MTGTPIGEKTINIRYGWTAIGWYNSTTRTPSEVLADIPGGNTIMKWEGGDKRHRRY